MRSILVALFALVGGCFAERSLAPPMQPMSSAVTRATTASSFPHENERPVREYVVFVDGAAFQYPRDSVRLTALIGDGADIEAIEIHKAPDARALYGARPCLSILVTTKRARSALPASTRR